MTLLKRKNIKNGIICTDFLSYCHLNKFPKFHLINKEDVVILNIGSGGEEEVGRVGINLTNMKFLFSGEIFKLTSDESVLLNKYLYYYLINFNSKVRNLATHGNVPHLYKNSLEKLKLSIPPLYIQQGIVKKLDKFADLLNIEGALKEEILFRKAQYESYRNLLFKKYCNN